MTAQTGNIRPMALDTEGPGLRERKRARTRRAIARAALELFYRQGFHETTLAQIAEAADVSPRTVSGYFPHKEELAFPDSDEAYASLERRLRERPPDETATDALRAWLEGWVHEHAGLEKERRMRRRIIAGDEGLRAYEHRFMVRIQDAIAEAIARDLGVAPRELEPRMAAAATLTVFVLLSEELKPAGTAGGDTMAALDRALLFIGAGIRALRG
jgi:AcrR family transcriptional regulator